jgi:transposase
MSKGFKAYNPHQTFLLPPSLRDWLPEDHLAYFVSDLVDELDLSEIYRPYQISDDRGQPAYHPRMMTKLLFYAYSVGVPSSRKIEEKTHTDVAFRLLAAGQHPDHDTICEFRSGHLEALAELFVQVLLLCRKAGLVKLGHVALDSTKVKANASKHKAMSYGRMCEAEKELERQVRELLEKARQVDEEEDSRYGKGKRGDELPEELRFRQGRLKKIRQAKEALERQARGQALAEGKVDEQGNPVPPKLGRRGGRGRVPKDPPGKPKPKDQRNFTDPDSRIMKDTPSKSFVQAYNAQAAVDSQAQVIVAADLTNEANDKQQVEAAVEQIEKNLGQRPKELSADAGYYSEDNVKTLQDAGVEALIPPHKHRHTAKDPPPPRGRIPNDLSAGDRMRRKLLTKRGKQKYSRRKEVVEPVFGQIKGSRGFRQFLLRGLQKVRGEWRLICLTHNILKLWRSGYAVAEG